jgi:hypothetical protein
MLNVNPSGFVLAQQQLHNSVSPHIVTCATLSRWKAGKPQYVNPTAVPWQKGLQLQSQR